MIKVSIIVPVYNVEKYIEKCLDSLVNQTLDSYEIILINDGSPDNSEKIIKKYQKKYPDKIVYLKKENGGQGSARNLGISHAKGEFLGFVDGDDYVEIDMFDKMYKTAKKEKAQIVSCDFMMYYENTNEFKKIKSYDGIESIKDHILNQPSLCNKLISKKIFDENNLRMPEGIYYEDYALTPLLAPLAKKIVHIDEYYYIYVNHNNSTMNQPKFNKKFYDIITATDNIFKEISTKKEIYIKYYPEYEFLIIENLLIGGFLRVRPYKEGKYIADEIVNWIRINMPKWYKNKYFRKKISLKKRIFNYLVYMKKYNLVGFGDKK